MSSHVIEENAKDLVPPHLHTFISLLSAVWRNNLICTCLLDVIIGILRIATDAEIMTCRHSGPGQIHVSKV